MKLSFVGANPHPRLEPLNRLDTHISYFLGNDPAKWHAEVPVWGGVRYVDLYPGVDLELSGEAGYWRPQIVTHNGADLSLVRLRIEGSSLVMLADNQIRLTTPIGDVTLPLLRVVENGSSPVPMRATGPRISGRELIAPFSRGEQDPLRTAERPTDLLYSTFLGGSAIEGGYDIAVDTSGAAYITGFTSSIDFPVTPGVVQPACAVSPFGCNDAFVTKLNPAGSAPIYSTFLGGSDLDAGYAIAIDFNGAAYVTGMTQSWNFPTTSGAFQRTCGGTCYYSDAFVTKINATGSALAYSTFLGGEWWDMAQAITTDSTGAAYVTGHTGSGDFPVTPGAFQTTCAGCGDAFVTKLNVMGSQLSYSTFLGGSMIEEGTGIALNDSGAAYVIGYTTSLNFPVTPGAFQPSCGEQYCNNGDAFVSKLNAAGNGLIYSTYLGGLSGECPTSARECQIAVDGTGIAHIVGTTASPDFPTTPGAFQAVLRGSSDVFVTKVNTNGTALVYSTFLGGNDSDSAHDIALDVSGSVYLTGVARSFDFPVTPGAFDPTCGCLPFYYGDAFVAKLNLDGNGQQDLLYSSYLGGSDAEDGLGIAIYKSHSTELYITGATGSPDFPVTEGAFQTIPTDEGSAFVTKMDTSPSRQLYYLWLPLILNNP
jgi:hypothetical protein